MVRVKHNATGRQNKPSRLKATQNLYNKQRPWTIIYEGRLDEIHALQWRHNGRDSVSNHQHHDHLLNRLLGHRSKKTSKLCVTGLCVGNSPHKWPVTRKMFPFNDVIMCFVIMVTFMAPQVINSNCMHWIYPTTVFWNHGDLHESTQQAIVQRRRLCSIGSFNANFYTGWYLYDDFVNRYTGILYTRVCWQHDTTKLIEKLVWTGIKYTVTHTMTAIKVYPFRPAIIPTAPPRYV